MRLPFNVSIGLNAGGQAMRLVTKRVVAIERL